MLGGTAPAARLDGYTAAGKTGTAQKIDLANGTIFAYASHCVIRWIRSDQQSGDDDINDAGFAGGPARRRASCRPGF